jgi:4-hydroxy-3-polyprenylbenzoate decarboxylase
MSACVEGPKLGESEFAWAGGVLGEPLEVIEGDVTGLPIPASAEIALEGFITLDETHKEGPYGEWTGYYQDGYQNERVIKIEKIYHRSDPIILGCPQGKPPHEDNRFLAYLRSGMIWDQLERAGVPGVTDVWSPPEAANRLMTVVALDTQYAGHGKQAGLIASQCGAGVEVNRLTVVVDTGVDVTQLKDVIWAMLTRSDPARDLDVIDGTKGARLDMAMGPHERERKLNSRMVIDATTPFHWKDHPDAGEPIASIERTRQTSEKWGWLLS